MLALYLVAVGLASGLMGIFVHGALAELGYTAGYQASLLLVGGVAAAYVCFQFLYYAVVMALKPSRGGHLPVSEAVSQCATLVFLPSLLNVTISWPDPLLERVEPLVFLGVFAVLHGFGKLLSFFAALQSPRGIRFWALGWLGLSGAAALGAIVILHGWAVQLEAARPEAPETAQILRVAGAYAEARPVAEGSVIEVALSDTPVRALTLRWAVPEEWSGTERPTQVHATIVFRGASRQTLHQSVRLRDDGWATMQISADSIPEGAFSCSISWSAQREPAWRRITGMRPVARTEQELLLSGPIEHYEDARADQPNIVILAVEGLSSEHMSRFGYDRATTPTLDSLAGSSLRFADAFTTAPEASAASMTILTGLYPLQHGYLGRHAGPLPTEVTTLPELLQNKGYATAAFTEGRNTADLLFGSGFERGFEIFDEAYDAGSRGIDEIVVEEPEDTDTVEPVTPPTAGSHATLEKARRWIDAHRDVRFMTFIRLTELQDNELRPWYGAPFTDASEEPSPRDVFDTTLAYLDRHIGAFLRHLQDQTFRQNTIVIVTSPYGLDFSEGDNQPPQVGIREMSLRVPVLVFAPWIGRGAREDLIGLEDIAPALLSISGDRFPHRPDGQSFLTGPNGNEPLSVYGDSLVMTKRSSRWRMVWDTGIEPFTMRPNYDAGSPRLYDIRRMQGGRWGSNVAGSNASLVNRWTEEMEQQLERHQQRWAP